jgi:SAM-dependent methyltransferase
LTRVRSLAGGALRSVLALRPDPLEEARRYVGTGFDTGDVQLDLLKLEGCLPSSDVLEIGCGCLTAGVPVMGYLDAGRYAGIEPNTWLVESALELRRVRRLVKRKRAVFLSRTDFDARELGRTYDYVLSHSVLSHCAHRQLDQFLENVGRVLRPEGRVVASIRLAEGNAYGSEGSPDRQDSRDEDWQYPGVSWFTFETVRVTAERHGLDVVVKPAYTELLTRRIRREFHDWLVFSASPIARSSTRATAEPRHAAAP